MTARAGRLRAFLRHVCHPSTVERLIDPIVSDIAVEYGEALRRGEQWRARWVSPGDPGGGSGGCLDWARLGMAPRSGRR
jgi:hypothetical protein